MKKVFKIIGKILVSLFIILILFLLIFLIYHKYMLNKEEKLLKNYPGELVEVNGHKMNVYVNGKGKHTLVFLAPAGDTSPVMTFKPLYSKLEDDYRVVVIEKFGYGMSDIVEDKRDYETMVKEMRTALEKLNIEGPYILCPYSKSGLDTLIWQQEYPEEVEAIISIDMAFPKSFESIDIPTKYKGKTLINFVKNTGLIRFFVSDSDMPDLYSKEEKDMMKTLVYRKYGNIVHFNEMQTVKETLKLINSNDKPNIPMHLFMSNGEGTLDDKTEWEKFANSYIEDLENVTITKYDSSHGKIIYENVDDMVKNIKEFLNKIEN